MRNSCLGTLLLNAHRYADAVGPFTNTTRLRPKFGPAYVNLCVAQSELKLLDEALANCEQGARLSPTEAESWFNLGRVRYELNNLTGRARRAGKGSVAEAGRFRRESAICLDVDLNRRDRQIGAIPPEGPRPTSSGRASGEAIATGTAAIEVAPIAMM